MIDSLDVLDGNRHMVGSCNPDFNLHKEYTQLCQESPAIIDFLQQ